MENPRRNFICTFCGYKALQWFGKCPLCGELNTFKEIIKPNNAALGKSDRESDNKSVSAENIKIDKGTEQDLLVWFKSKSTKSFFALHSFLGSFVNDYQNTITKLTKDCEEKINAATIKRDEKIKLLENQCEAANKYIIAERENYCDAVNQRWTNSHQVEMRKYMEAYKFEVSYTGELVPIIASNLGFKGWAGNTMKRAFSHSLRNDIIQSANRLKDDATECTSKIQKTKKQFDNYVRNVCQANEQKKRFYTNCIVNDCAEYVKKVNSFCESEKKRITDGYAHVLSGVVSKEKFEHYISQKKECEIEVNSYRCAENTPEFIYLGEAEYTLAPATGRLYSEIINMFSALNCSNISAGEKGITVRMPMFRTVDDGYSLYIRNSDYHSEQSKNVLNAYIMKMMMLYPAGQFTPVLIDEGGSPDMAMFSIIGASSDRNIVTRPWNTANDISDQLEFVARKKAELNATYGTNLKSRMEREPIYMTAVRAFPRGFGEGAFSSLSKILESGAAGGMMGIITTDSRLLEEATQDKVVLNNAISSIERCCLNLDDAGGGKYKIRNSDAPAVYLSLDTFESAMEESKSKKIIAKLIEGIKGYKRQTESFEGLFSKDVANVGGFDVNNMGTWFTADATKEFAVPVGVSGAQAVVEFRIEGTRQHALISGTTGSGKSSFLKTLIVAAMIKYKPENLQMYLIDFKEGVEFAHFSHNRLPWIKALTINTEREFALSVLRKLKKEFRIRAGELQDERMSRFGDYGETSAPPRILLICDEVEDLLCKSDEITTECIDILSTLVREGRAMNINVILASQDFTNCIGINQIKEKMGISVAYAGCGTSSECILGDKYSAAELETGDSGYAAMVKSKKDGVTYFQTGYLERENLEEILAKLEKLMEKAPCRTRIMTREIKRDRSNRFSGFLEGQIEKIRDENKYEMYIGDNFQETNDLYIGIGGECYDNMLIVGEDENKAMSMYSLMILSFLYNEIANHDKILDDELVYIADVLGRSSESSDSSESYFEQLGKMFPKQVKVADRKHMDTQIHTAYEKLLARKKGEADKSERLFLMVLGIDSVIKYRKDRREVREDSVMDTVDKLVKLIEDGPQNGINCIIYSSTLRGLEKVFDRSLLNRAFNHSIYFGTDADECENVTGATVKENSLTGNSVVYQDIEESKPVFFRAYDLPDLNWIEEIADKYREYISEKE